MGKSLILSLFLACLSSMAFAQHEKEEKEIEQAIATLFKGMKDKNQSLLVNAFHEDAIMQTVAESPEGTELGSNTVEEFINRIAVTPAETTLDEQIQSYHIRVDGNMASAWTPYRFYVNDKFSHCGVNSFQMIRIDEQWKIAHIIDTRRKDNCN